MPPEEDDALLESFLDDLSEAFKNTLIVVTEHRLVEIKDDDGIIIQYHQEEWAQDPDLVTQMIEDVVLGLKAGPIRLRERITKRRKRFGDDIGTSVSNDEAVLLRIPKEPAELAKKTVTEQFNDFLIAKEEIITPCVPPNLSPTEVPVTPTLPTYVLTDEETPF